VTTDPRRDLPSVERLLHLPAVAALIGPVPRTVVVAAVREAIDAARRSRSAPPEDWSTDVADRIHRRQAPSLRAVLNATGVVLHTNLGRAPLSQAAAEAMAAVAESYSTLEFDLPSGTRGHRADHSRELLALLSGAEDALVVNNAAGALVLALGAVADTRPVLISRGELIEIGGSFRIPDIMERSGAVLREVGTTNRTHIEDYRRELGGVAAILTIHRSNFEQRGFVTTPAPADLAALARDAGIPYIYDVGSGLLADLSAHGLTGEPRVSEAVRSGADLVLFSGDKLLGGPQAGCLVGRTDLVQRCRQNPLARALRADRFTLAALDATLRLYQDPDRALREIPVLVMLTLRKQELHRRASLLAAECPPALEPELRAGFSAVGGGSFPGVVLPTTLVALSGGNFGAEGLALRLRLGPQPIVSRVADGRVLLDPRTLPLAAYRDIGAALRRAVED
jgi:L-seryl-tRNA(Ser) seleniumtransferase